MPRRSKILTPPMLHAVAAKGTAPTTPLILHEFIHEVLGVEVATAPLLDGAAAPFDYLVHTFFEGAYTRRDHTRRFWRHAPGRLHPIASCGRRAAPGRPFSAPS